jgi:aconitate hydratase A / 2-methylisocitrate dehydratase
MEEDRISSILGLQDLQPGKPVLCYLHHSDGKREEINLKHSYTSLQIEWFSAGSALNVFARDAKLMLLLA